VRGDRVRHVHQGVDAVQYVVEALPGEEVHTRRAGARDHSVLPVLWSADGRPTRPVASTTAMRIGLLLPSGSSSRPRTCGF
jgi:hypothetical protein